MEKKKPLYKRWLPPFQMAIWENDTNGKRWYSTTFKRTYKKGSEDVTESISVAGANALLTLRELTDSALLQLREYEANQEKTQGSDEGEEETSSSDAA